MNRLMMMIVIALALGIRAEERTYDVAVVGAGPAGIGAALTAAQTGAKVVVLERNNYVGGTTVSAEVSNIGLFHAWRKLIITGPCWNLVSNLCTIGKGRFPDIAKQNGDRNWWVGTVFVEPQPYAAAAEHAILKAGCTLHLNSTVTSVSRRGTLWTLTCRTKTGPATVTAREIVDATGSATIAAFAGAMRLRSPDEARQPGSFFFYWNTTNANFNAAALDKAHAEAVRKGELLPTDIFVTPSSYVKGGGGWGTYVPLADDSTDEALARTRKAGEALKTRIRTFLRRQPGLENAEIYHSAPEVGVRETYTVVGEEEVTEKDYLNGTIHPDTVCWSFWMIDPHDTRRKIPEFKFHENGKVGTIRLKAMMPKGVKHILVAGRAIASDHNANSALRVQASCMAIGQAAGITAALAAKRGCDVREVPLKEIKAALRAVGATVPEAPEQN